MTNNGAFFFFFEGMAVMLTAQETEYYLKKKKVSVHRKVVYMGENTCVSVCEGCVPASSMQSKYFANV